MVEKDPSNDEKAPEGDPGTAEILAAVNEIRSEIEQLRESQANASLAASERDRYRVDAGAIETCLAMAAISAVLLTQVSDGAALAAETALYFSAFAACMLGAYYVATALGVFGPPFDFGTRLVFMAGFALFGVALVALFATILLWTTRWP